MQHNTEPLATHSLFYNQNCDQDSGHGLHCAVGVYHPIREYKLTLYPSVQEGLIFVAMSQENLLDRTSRYKIRRCPAPPLPAGTMTLYSEADSYYERPHRTFTSVPRPGWSSRVYTDNSRIYSTSTDRPPSRRIDLPPVRVMPSGETANHPGMQPRVDHWESDNPDDDRTPPPDDVYPAHLSNQARPAQTASLPSAGFTITTTCDDPSGDEEEPSTPSILRDRQRRRGNFRPNSTSSDDDAASPTRRYGRLRAVPRKIDLEPKSGPDYGSEGDGEALVPHARFFIERKKNVVSIKFDPPM